MRRELNDTEKSRLDSLKTALGSNLNSRAKLDLLAYWARHPSGWSSNRVVAPHSSVGSDEIAHALRELVESGVLEVNQSGSVSFYGLARKHAAYEAVLQLGKLTPKRRKYLMRAVHGDPAPLATGRALLMETA